MSLTPTTVSYSAQQMMESALRRAGVKQAQWSGEIVAIAFDVFNLMLNEMLNLGIQLWGRDRFILPLYENINALPCPLGTSVVISANQRTTVRAEALAPFSTNGGVAANAFDDNFATSCVQSSPNGAIGTTFSTPFQVTTVGVLVDSPGTFGIFYEYSLDNVNWFAIDANTFEVTAGRPSWFWYDISGAPPAIGWRIRSVSDQVLSVAELYFGNSPTEIPMGKWSLDDWNAMVVKNTPGAPWNWYQDRQIDVPVLYVWPMPDTTAVYLQIVCYRRRYLAALSDIAQTLDLSRRWYEALTASLARRLCRELPEADMNRYQMLSQEESISMTLAAGEERDPAPMKFQPGLEVYRF